MKKYCMKNITTTTTTAKLCADPSLNPPVFLEGRGLSCWKLLNNITATYWVSFAFHLQKKVEYRKI